MPFKQGSPFAHGATAKRSAAAALACPFRSATWSGLIARPPGSPNPAPAATSARMARSFPESAARSSCVHPCRLSESMGKHGTAPRSTRAAAPRALHSECEQA